jgi:IS4 transposase
MLFEVIEEHALSAADRLAGVLSMQTVRTVGWRGQQALGGTPLKLVCIGLPDGTTLRLLTNRVDLDTELIGMVYRYRWQIELFFRWLKCLVNFRHFFSESPEGVALQIGAAVIGTLLIALTIQDKPSSYDWAMVTHVVNGLIPLDEETLQIMAQRRAQRARADAWQKAYRARQKATC